MQLSSLSLVALVIVVANVGALVVERAPLPYMDAEQKLTLRDALPHLNAGERLALRDALSYNDVYKALAERGAGYDQATHGLTIAKRAGVIGVPGDSIKCGNEKYTGSTIQKAVDKGFSLAVAGKRIGDNKYPHPYGFHDKFDSLGPCKRGMPGIYEFPVERGAVYSGGKVDQLSERVVFQMKVNKGIYCGIITHKGAPTAKGFLACK